MGSAIRFKSKHPTHAWLSNFSEDGFEIEGTRWESVEHYYQAQKYSGTEAFNHIREARTPLKARKAGQDRSLTPRADWDEVKLDVMQDALVAKFTQNPRLKRMLIETGDRELIHESKSDQFWGCSNDGDGQNHLGILLMRIRSELA